MLKKYQKFKEKQMWEPFFCNLTTADVESVIYLKKDFNERGCLVIQLVQSRTKTHSHIDFFSLIAFTVQALPKRYCDIAVFINQYLSAAMIKKYMQTFMFQLNFTLSLQF